MPMKWTPEATAAAKKAEHKLGADVVDVAIVRAEQLAEAVGANIVDTALWRQAVGLVTHTRQIDADDLPDLP